MSAGESFADWLSVIVVSDDPANGGAGLLVLSDCAKCDGHGIVERSHRSGMRLEPCPVCADPVETAAPDGNTCDGCGNAYPHALATWQGHAGQGEYCAGCLPVARTGNPLHVANVTANATQGEHHA